MAMATDFRKRDTTQTAERVGERIEERGGT